MTDRAVGPLRWTTPGGYTPESVRRSNRVGSIPVAAVVAMLDAADEAHLKSLYEENNRGGEARQVVADVARILGTDIDAGPGHRWDADHMQRVVADARKLTEALVDEGARNVVSLDLLRREKEHAAELGQYARRMERERDILRERLASLETSAEYWSATAPGGSLIDDLKNTIVSQAREIARLKGESA